MSSKIFEPVSRLEDETQSQTINRIINTASSSNKEETKTHNNDIITLHCQCTF